MTEEPYPQSLYSLFLIELALAFFLLLALLNGRRDLALFVLLLLALMTAARLWSRVSFRRLRIHMQVDRCKLFPQETFEAAARLENLKWLPVRVRLQMHFPRGLLTADNGAAHECGLLWHQSGEMHWHLQALQRGVYRLGSDHCRAGDYFGFYLQERRLEGAAAEVIVYPRLKRIKGLAPLKKELFGAPGAKDPVQDPVYFLGTRDYHPWQPARHIHWKASARHGRLHEKIFEPSAHSKTLLLFDAAGFARADAGRDFERMIEAAAATALDCARRGHALGFLTNAVVEGGPDRVPVSHAPHQLSAVLETMARMQMRALRPLDELLRCEGALPWGVSSVCFTYTSGESLLCLGDLFHLRRLPLALVLCRRPDQGLAAPAGACVLEEMELQAVHP